MAPTDRPEFLRVLNGLAAIKRVDLTPEAIGLWWSAMSRWSIEDFRSAASHLVSAHEWMPSPFHFEQLRRAGQATAGEAWLNVLSGEQLAPGSRAARAAQIVGGQWLIRHADVERDLPFIQSRFLDAYDQLSDVDSARDAVPQICDAKKLSDLRKLLA